MKRVIIEIDVTYERSDEWGAVSTKDLLKVFLDKSAEVKNISIKKVNKQSKETE